MFAKIRSLLRKKNVDEIRNESDLIKRLTYIEERIHNLEVECYKPASRVVNEKKVFIKNRITLCGKVELLQKQAVEKKSLIHAV